MKRKPKIRKISDKIPLYPNLNKVLTTFRLFYHPQSVECWWKITNFVEISALGYLIYIKTF